MTQAENRRGLQLNPGHHDMLRNFLDPVPEPLLPETLVQHAIDNDYIESVLHILNQELGNTAFLMDAFELLVEDLKDAVAALSPESIEKAVSLLKSYDEIMLKGTENAGLIISTLARIQEADKEASSGGGQTLMTGKSIEYVQTIIRDFTRLQKVLTDKGETFEREYQAAKAKVTEYLEKNPSTGEVAPPTEPET